MKSLVSLILMVLWPTAAALAEVPKPGRVAFFGLQFIDLSTEGAMNGVRTDESARTEMATDLLSDSAEFLRTTPQPVLEKPLTRDQLDAAIKGLESPKI